VAITVTSVGPYRCRITVSGQLARTRANAPGLTTSPPVDTSRSGANTSGATSATAANSPAVRLTAVSRCLAISDRSTPAST
jgi:hypothetical protein